jgi:hypothetical protein
LKFTPGRMGKARLNLRRAYSFDKPSIKNN